MYQIKKAIKESAHDHSSVYLAEHKQTETEVCIKRIRLDKLQKRDEVFQVLQKYEFATLEQVDHPKITRILQTIKSEQTVDIVMEYAAEGSLGNWIKSQFIGQGRIKEDTVVYIMKQLMQGISYLHEKGICHRDLKPDNILIEDFNFKDQPYVKLTDFGYATVFKSD